MRLWTVRWMALVACLIEPFAMRCGAQVTLSWNPSASAGVASYNVCWGTNSGNYIYTNNYPNTITTVTISNLATNEVFFFAVQTVGTNGQTSDFSNEESYTNVVAAITAMYSVATQINPANAGSATGGGSFAAGSSATVTATANSGYMFSNWTANGAVQSTSANYTFTVASNCTLTANFTAVTAVTAVTTMYSVATQINPANAGSVTGGGTFAAGSSATVTATANSGYTFSNWTANGSVQSTSANYTFTVASNCTLTANFTAMYRIYKQSNPTNAGSVTGGGAFAAGSSATVTATANSGYTFSNWTANGSVQSTSAKYTFAVASNCTLTANFTAMYSVTTQINPANAGSITGGGAFAAGSSVTVTATANSGYTFSNWTANGSVQSTSAKYTFTVASNCTLTANLRPATPPTNVVPSTPLLLGLVVSNGQVNLAWNPSTNTGVADYNVCWGTNSGNYVYTNIYTNTITNIFTNATISNLAGNVVFFFAVQAVGTNGLVSDFSNEESTNVVSKPTITVVPISPSAPLLLGLAGSNGQVNLTWNPSTSPGVASNNVCWGTNSGNYIYTNSYTNTITNATISNLAANEAFFFAVQSVSTNGLSSDFSNEESYTNVVYSVATQINPASAGGVTGGGAFAAGSSVTVTATANSGYTFSNWTANGAVQSTSANYTFTVASNCTLTANFTAMYSVATQINPASAGRVTGGGNFAAGSSATVTATANSGYTFSNWTANGAVQSTLANYTFTVASNCTLTANLRPTAPPTNVVPSTPLLLGLAVSNGQVNLAWNPSTNTGVADYNVCWGTNSGIYIYTNIYTNTITNIFTNATISNLTGNEVFFFAVQAVGTNGLVSDFSNEESTNVVSKPTITVVPISPSAPLLLGLAGSNGQVNLTWNPSTSPGVASYNVCWGNNSGNYIYTNTYPNTITSVTISSLASNEVFFFAVQAVSTNGSDSDFSNEESYTNATPPGSPGTPPGGPPSPPGGPGLPTNGNPPIVVSPPGGGGPSTNITSTNITQSTFWGVPPFLALAVSNGRLNLTVNGTVGANLNIYGTTGDIAMNEWSAVTNLTLTNIASFGETNQQGLPQDVLDLAFVPGTQTVPINTKKAAPFEYFQVVMPYDYVILADQVLLGNSNYTPRLILVNMPGLVDDACYVNQASSFIHYTHTNSALQLISSSSTIRDIANGLANWLNLDWTSASEFTYSNGMGQILATVIETEPPSSDPVAGQNPPSSPIPINF